jgi:thiopurine S-methyltransferase
VQPQFWLERWQAGQIGFHQADVDRLLTEFWPRLKLPKASRVLVPLCGKSLDLLWLRAQGHTVVGVELSEIALQAFCAEHAINAKRRSLPNFDLYEAENFELLRGDFFVLTPDIVGEVAAIYDRAALISWAPELRTRYVEHLTNITAPDAQTLLITLEYEQTQMHGPPFSVDSTEVRRLYAKSHHYEELVRRDALKDEPRFKSRGVNALTEIAYQLVRTPDPSAGFF